MLNIGFLTTVSGRWPRELPMQRNKLYGEYVKNKFPFANIIECGDIVDSAEKLLEVTKLFRRENVDLIIMVYGAFTGDDICTCLAENLRVPLVLWTPYEPPFDGGRLLANALVAATMNSASLGRLGHTSHMVYGSLDDPRAVGEILKIVKAYSVVKELKGKVLGLFGYRPTAFYNSAFDEALIRRTFGIRMEETDLKVVIDVMRDVDDDLVQADMADVANKFDISTLPHEYLENHSRLFFALKQTMRIQGYDFAVLKCWPEMGNWKMTPCAVLGRLADENMLIGCEGDVDVMLALIIQYAISGTPGFITDMINIDETENTLTFWHCGNPAPSLTDDTQPICLGNHPLAGQGTAFYASLKSGKVTVARMCNIDGKYKLFLVRGEAVPTNRNTTGSMINVKIQRPVRDFVYQLIAQQIPHHYSVVWDDIADDMKQVASLLGIEVLEL